MKPLNPPQRTSLSPRHRPSDESLRRENNRLRGENERLQRIQQQQAEQIAKQEQEIADRKKELADKNGEIAELERQLALRKQNSTNSSKPPSSDGLAGESRERGGKQKKSRRKPGGQPGHRGSALLIQVLGAVFEGILCSDRFSGYSKYHQGQAQLCWAHLQRNILGVLDFTKKSATKRFCRDALALHARNATAGAANQLARFQSFRSASTQKNTNGVTIPVSFTSTKTTQAAADHAYFRFTKKKTASSVNTMHGMSNCAIMLCVKNNGDTNKNTGGKNAGAPLAPLLNSIASKKVVSPAPTATAAIFRTSVNRAKRRLPWRNVPANGPTVLA